MGGSAEGSADGSGYTSASSISVSAFPASAPPGHSPACPPPSSGVALALSADADPGVQPPPVPPPEDLAERVRAGEGPRTSAEIRRSSSAASLWRSRGREKTVPSALSSVDVYSWVAGHRRNTSLLEKNRKAAGSCALGLRRGGSNARAGNAQAHKLFDRDRQPPWLPEHRPGNIALQNVRRVPRTPRGAPLAPAPVRGGTPLRRARCAVPNVRCRCEADCARRGARRAVARYSRRSSCVADCGCPIRE